RVLFRSIRQLTNLTSLAIFNNDLSSLPVEIGELTGLTYLSLFNNSLNSVPEELGLLTNLEILDLLENNLTTIPQVVCDLETAHGTTIDRKSVVTCMP